MTSQDRLEKRAATLLAETVPFLRSRHRFNWQHERAHRAIDAHSAALQRLVQDLDRYLESPPAGARLLPATVHRVRAATVDVVMRWRDLCQPGRLDAVAEGTAIVTPIAQLDEAIRTFDASVTDLAALLADLTPS